MIITELLEKNAELYKDDVSLVEINPPLDEPKRLTWKEYSLIETASNGAFRTEITWDEFNKKANRFANLLLSRGIKKGDKVAILLMNCLEEHLQCRLITDILLMKLSIVLSWQKLMCLFSALNLQEELKQYAISLKKYVIPFMLVRIAPPLLKAMISSLHIARKESPTLP